MVPKQHWFPTVVWISTATTGRAWTLSLFIHQFQPFIDYFWLVKDKANGLNFLSTSFINNLNNLITTFTTHYFHPLSIVFYLLLIELSIVYYVVATVIYSLRLVHYITVVIFYWYSDIYFYLSTIYPLLLAHYIGYLFAVLSSLHRLFIHYF